MIKKQFLTAITVLISILLVFPIKTANAYVPDPWVITVDDFSDAPDYVHNSVCSAGAITGGPCTLRAAIDEANKCPDSPGACDGGVIIRVPPGVYTLTIPPTGENDNSSGDLDIDPWEVYPKFIIEGTDPDDPPVIDANGIDRVIEVHNTTIPISLRSIGIRGGNLQISDADQNGKLGAGIASWIASLTLYDVVIEDNQVVCADGTTLGVCSSGVGGGIYAYGELVMGLSTIRNNAAPRGGGLFTSGTADKVILNSTFNGNESGVTGGAIVNYAVTLMQNSTVSDNSAKYAGGIANYATLSLYNVTIAGNTSLDSWVANLYNSGTFTIKNSIIAYPVGPSGVPNCMDTGAWNDLDTNLYSDTSCGTGEGILSNTDPKLTSLGWFGGQTMTRGLLEGSPAHDAVDASCLDYTNINPMTYDQRGADRDAKCDLGAFEGTVYGVYLPTISR